MKEISNPSKLSKGQLKVKKKASLKPLLTYRLDNKSSLDKLKGKIYYENKKKAGACSASQCGAKEFIVELIA